MPNPNSEPNSIGKTLDEFRQYIDPQTLIFSPPDDFRTRNDEMDESYQLHKIKVLRKWESLEDYCKVKILKWGYFKLPNGKYKANHYIFGWKKEGLTLANFPYFLEEGVEHYILWLIGYSDEKIAIQSVKQELENLGFDLEKTAIFRNEVKNLSVAGFPHIHFLTRK